MTTSLKFGAVKPYESGMATLPIVLIYNNRRIDTPAIVDSGASVCSFNSDLAQALQIPLNQFPVTQARTAGGVAKAWSVPLKIQVAGKIVDTTAQFLDTFREPFGLLGQQGFFSHFRVAFQGSLSRFLYHPEGQP